MAAYDDFAWFYNLYWNEEFHGLAFPILERIWLARLPESSRILDVCCGTGYLAGLLAARGHAVTGVDASPEMIRHARANAPEWRISRGDCGLLPAARGVRRRRLDIRQPEPPVDAGIARGRVPQHPPPRSSRAGCWRSICCSKMPIGRTGASRSPWCATTTSSPSPAPATTSATARRSAPSPCSACSMARGAVRTRPSTSAATRPGKSGAALNSAGFGEVLAYDAGDLGMAGQLGEGRTFFVATRA